jgi:hypothetical protein
MFGRESAIDIGNELEDDRIGRGYPLGSRPIQYKAWFIILLLVPRIGHFRSRDLIERKLYASNFERIRAQTLPEMAKPLITTTT